MSDKLQGSGTVLNENGVQTGTYKTTPNGFNYDDDSGQNDKTWRWLDFFECYLYPDHANLATALCMVRFKCIASTIDNACFRWKWEELCRETSNDPWPEEPTATGECIKS